MNLCSNLSLRLQFYWSIIHKESIKYDCLTFEMFYSDDLELHDPVWRCVRWFFFILCWLSSPLFLCLTLITLSKIKESNKSLTTLFYSIFSHFPPIQSQFLCTYETFYRFNYREMDKSPNFDHSTEIKWMIYFSVHTFR